MEKLKSAREKDLKSRAQGRTGLTRCSNRLFNHSFYVGFVCIYINICRRV